MVDNFAIPAATIRGLFDYDYKWDRLILRPRIPGSINQYNQKEPVRFGEKRIYLSCKNGGPKVKSVKINGKKIKIESPEEIALIYSDLPNEAKVEIVTEGGWEKQEKTADYPSIPELVNEQAVKSELPDSLQKPFAVLTELDKLLSVESGADYDRSLVKAALESFEAYQYRVNLEVGPGYFRPVDLQRKEAMIRSFAKAAVGMYRGVEKRMENYALQGNQEQKHIASLFIKAKND
jgi:hypothetical protein